MRFHGQRYCQACQRGQVPLVPAKAKGSEEVKWICEDPRECLEAYKRRAALLVK